MKRVERTIVIEGDDEWVYRTLGSALVGSDRPVYECPRGTITETARSDGDGESSGTATNEQQRERFVNALARYIKGHKDWKNLQPEAAVRAAAWVLVSDRTAFDDLCGVWAADASGGARP